LHYNMSLVDLSAQNIIDCTSASFDCDGGYPWAGVIAIKGIEAEADYPYKGALGPCAFNESKSLLTVDNQIQRGFIREDNIKFGELLIKTYLPVKGPIAAAMDGRSDAFKNYKSGVFYDSSCSQQLKDLKHGVLIVGYGTDPKEGDYWIAVSIISVKLAQGSRERQTLTPLQHQTRSLQKNSWGSEWGEQGYVRIARNRPNNCGLHKMASFLP